MKKFRTKTEIEERIENYRSNLSLKVDDSAKAIMKRGICELQWVLGGDGK